MMHNSQHNHRQGAGRTSNKAIEPALSEKERDLLKSLDGFGFGNKQILSALVALAEKRNSPSRGDIDGVLRGAKISPSSKLIGTILSAIGEYRKAHRRAVQEIHEATISHKVDKRTDLKNQTRGVSFCLKRWGLTISPKELWEKAQEALSQTAGLFEPKKPYCGYDTRVIADCESSAPHTAEEEFRVIVDAGHDPTKIVDNLMIAAGLSATSPVESVLALYPAKRGDPSAYRVAVERVCCFLNAPQEFDMLDEWGASADRYAQVFNSNRRLWSHSARHPHLSRLRGPAIVVEPSIDYLPCLMSLSTNTPFAVTCSKFWEGGVFVDVCQARGARAAVLQKPLSPALCKDLSDKPALVLVCQAVNYFDHMIRDGLQMLARRLPAGGKLVFEFDPYPEKRWHASCDRQAAFYRRLMAAGDLTVQFEFGKSVMSEIGGDLKRLFYPANAATKDRIIFTKVAQTDRAAETDNLTSGIKCLQTMASFQDPGIWDWMISVVDTAKLAMEGRQSGIWSFVKNMMAIGDIWSDKDHGISGVVKHINKQDYEKLAQEVVLGGILNLGIASARYHTLGELMSRLDRFEADTDRSYKSLKAL